MILSRVEKSVEPKKRMIVAEIHVMGPRGERIASILLNDEKVREKKLAVVTAPNPSIVPDQETLVLPVVKSRMVHPKSTMMAIILKRNHLLVSKKSRVIGRKKRGSAIRHMRRIVLAVLLENL